MSKIYPTIYNKQNFPFIQLIEGSAAQLDGLARRSEGLVDGESRTVENSQHDSDA